MFKIISKKKIDRLFLFLVNKSSPLAQFSIDYEEIDDDDEDEQQQQEQQQPQNNNNNNHSWNNHDENSKYEFFYDFI